MRICFGFGLGMNLLISSICLGDSEFDYNSVGSAKASVTVEHSCSASSENDGLFFGDIFYTPEAGKECDINIGSQNDLYNECNNTVSFNEPPHNGYIWLSCGSDMENGTKAIATITEYDEYLVLDGAGESPTASQKIKVNSVGFNYNAISGTGDSTQELSVANSFGEAGAEFYIGGSVTLPSSLSRGIYGGNIKVTIVLE